MAVEKIEMAAQALLALLLRLEQPLDEGDR